MVSANKHVLVETIYWNIRSGNAWSTAAQTNDFYGTAPPQQNLKNEVDADDAGVDCVRTAVQRAKLLNNKYKW